MLHLIDFQHFSYFLLKWMQSFLFDSMFLYLFPLSQLLFLSDSKILIKLSISQSMHDQVFHFTTNQKKMRIGKMIQFLILLRSMIFQNFIIPMNNILIPELNILTNDSDLRSKQKKVLAAHYQQQIQSTNKKRQRTADVQVPNYGQLNRMYADYQRGIQTELSRTYENEIQQKQKIRKAEKSKRLMQEEEMVKQVKQIQQEQMEKKRLADEAFRLHAQEEYANKLKEKAANKEKEEKQKELFRQRQHSLKDLRTEKLRNFHQHYNYINGIQEKLKNDYLKHVAPQNQKREGEKQRIIDRGIQQNSALLKLLYEKEQAKIINNRNSLRESLEKQIKEKEEKKNKEKEQLRRESYTSMPYSHKYHPINNPVDFKITHDNPYIMKQLVSSEQPSNMTQLARSGSQLLLG